MSRVNCTAHMMKIMPQRYLGSRLVLKSCQYVDIRNESDVIAEYDISSHCNQSIGIAHKRQVIMNDENEYP